MISLMLPPPPLITPLASRTFTLYACPLVLPFGHFDPPPPPAPFLCWTSILPPPPLLFSPLINLRSCSCSSSCSSSSSSSKLLHLLIPFSLSSSLALLPSHHSPLLILMLLLLLHTPSSYSSWFPAPPPPPHPLSASSPPPLPSSPLFVVLLWSCRPTPGLYMRSILPLQVADRMVVSRCVRGIINTWQTTLMVKSDKADVHLSPQWIPPRIVFMVITHRHSDNPSRLYGLAMYYWNCPTDPLTKPNSFSSAAYSPGLCPGVGALQVIKYIYHLHYYQHISAECTCLRTNVYHTSMVFPCAEGGFYTGSVIGVYTGRSRGKRMLFYL